MLYAILCYNDEAVTSAWTKDEDDAVMAKLELVHEKVRQDGKLGPAIRLLPTTSATTLRKAQNLVVDGPYAETKEQLLGFYMIEARDLNEAIRIASGIPPARVGSIEVRPIRPIRETVAAAQAQQPAS